MTRVEILYVQTAIELLWGAIREPLPPGKSYLNMLAERKTQALRYLAVASFLPPQSEVPPDWKQTGQPETVSQ